jgi:DNA-binding NarL/FixJ family response regulator
MEEPLKSTPPSQLVDAIRAAHAGGSPISPEMAREVVHLFQRTGPPHPPGSTFNPTGAAVVVASVAGAQLRIVGAADERQCEYRAELRTECIR